MGVFLSLSIHEERRNENRPLLPISRPTIGQGFIQMPDQKSVFIVYYQMTGSDRVEKRLGISNRKDGLIDISSLLIDNPTQFNSLLN
jgi:hypothetical protein